MKTPKCVSLLARVFKKVIWKSSGSGICILLPFDIEAS